MSPAFLRRLDWQLLLPVFVLVILSLTTLASINQDLFRSQLSFFFFSLVVFFFVSQMQGGMFARYAPLFYGLSIVGLLIVLLVGLESRGAVRWLEFFGFQIQISEITKPLFAVSLSAFLASRAPTFRTLFLASLLLLPIAFLIQIQPDLGSALLYVLVSLFVFFVYGFAIRWFLVGFVAFAAVAPLIYTFVLHDYQKNRITSFLSLTSDPLGKSYNAIQSVIAVGSGMLIGKGLGQSTQSGLRFLPERHTDFIFATISEGLGFFGAAILLLAFAALFYRIFVLYQNAQTPFAKLFSLFTFFFLFVQFFVNAGMNIALLPIVGITLPFVSYGGSSLLANFILLGILCAIHSGVKRHSVLEIR